MHARVTTLDAAPDRIDEATGRIRNDVLPALRELDGYAGIISLIDRRTGRSITATLWETEEALRASEERANAIRSQTAREMGAAGEPTVDRYEVVLADVRTPVTA